GAASRDRLASRLGDRARSADRHPNAPSRCGLCLHQAAWRDAHSGQGRAEIRIEGQMVVDQRTVWNLLSAGREDDTAISAPEGPPLSHGGLRRLVTRIGASLNARGIRRNDRIGIVLPNGPHMAFGFPGTAARSTA